MTYENRKYVIIDTNEVSGINFNEVLEHSASMLRYNNDNTKTFVKFEGSTPSFLNGKTQYTHTQILAILNDEEGEWYIEDE
tara:strand:+ start:2040 stop:2282 length:243 start_codon:yes stop_codon:yes gene_type:complete